MVPFLVRRLLQGVAVVFVVVTLTFVLIHAAPGEPFANVLEDPRVTAEVRDAWRAHYGLDRPLGEQYVRYLASAARGDLGTSFTYQRPATAVLAAAIPRTLLLMSVALALSFAGGIALGASQAARQGSWFDRLTGGASVVIAALPDFWVAMVALSLFALRWRLAPAGGMVDEALHRLYSPGGRVLDVLRHLALPAGTLALVIGAAVARYQRASLIDALPEDYVRTARAKGLAERAVVFRHALRNALLPTITLFGLAFPALLGGAVFVEFVFAWLGMGSMTAVAVASRDYPLVLASAIAGSVMVVMGGVLADVLHATVDPRAHA